MKLTPLKDFILPGQYIMDLNIIEKVEIALIPLSGFCLWIASPLLFGSGAPSHQITQEHTQHPHKLPFFRLLLSLLPGEFLRSHCPERGTVLGQTDLEFKIIAFLDLGGHEHVLAVNLCPGTTDLELVTP